MKLIPYQLSFLFAAFLISGCKQSTKESTEVLEGSTGPADSLETSYHIDPRLSMVKWEGKVIGVYGHHGVISIKEGTLITQGVEIASGSISIDMQSIVPLDSASYQDRKGARITDLQSHLTTGDFFLTEDFPESLFVVKSQQNNQLVGDLTIRGITREETVTLSYLEVLPEGLVGDGVLVFNRQDYGINWEHPITDYILSDNIHLKISLIAKAVTK